MKAILSVIVREGYTVTHHPDETRILYHSRKGLTPDQSKATRFKTLNYAVKAARKKYTPQLARDLKSWSATTIEDAVLRPEESQP